MKIVNILGGLGNQMFQYAFALALQNQHPNEIIKIDTTAFKGYSLHNGFELANIFNIQLPIAQKRDVLRLSYPTFHYRLWQLAHHYLPELKSQYREKQSMIFDPRAIQINESIYYDGYWQSEKYFSNCQPLIHKAFTFPRFEDIKNFEILNYIKNKTSASIHIRRGDYVNNKHFGNICTVDYYKAAIKKISQICNIDIFLIFSNDIPWCQNTFMNDFEQREVIYVDWNKGSKSYCDMQLMSCCTHNIIANSSFSWWGAWLNSNPNKLVITPSQWKRNCHNLDILPDSWIKIQI